jgi:hypothetical protein
MHLGELIFKERTRQGMSRAELDRRLRSHGFTLAGSTLRDWETGNRDFSMDWNPYFLHALSDALGLPEMEILSRLGFDVGLPKEIPPAALVVAMRIGAIEDSELRKKAVDLVNLALDIAGL